MKITPSGIAVGGVASDGVYVGTTKIKEGGTATTNGDRVFYQSTAGTVRSCRLDGSDDQLVLNQGASLIVAGGPHWAVWLANVGLETSWGLKLKDAAPLAMTDAGDLLVIVSYSSGKGIALYRAGESVAAWALPNADPIIRYPYPQAFALDADRIVWANPSGKLFTRGLQAPAQTEPAVFDPFLIEHPDGSIWVGYHTYQFVIHPLGDASFGYIVDTGLTYGTTATGGYVGFSRTGGESAMETLQVDWSQPLVSLAPPPPPKPIGPTGPPLPEGTEIDLAPFLVYDPAVWPRGGNKTNGDDHAYDMQPVMHKGEPCFWHAVFGDDGKGRLGSLVQIKDGFLHLLSDCHNRDNTGHPDGPFIDTWSDTRWIPLKMRVGRKYSWTAPDHTIRKHREDGTIFKEYGSSKEHWVHEARMFWCGESLGERMAVRFAQNNTGIKPGQTTTIPGLGMESDYIVMGAGRCRWTYDRAMDVFVGPNHAPIFPETPQAQSDFWHVGGPRYPPVIPPWIPLATEVQPVTVPLPTDVQATIRAFAAINPLPQGPADDEGWQSAALRYLPNGWTAKLAQQLAFSHGPDWGQKRRGPGAETSAGRIARREAGGFRDWDILIAAASGRPTLTVNVESEGLITDQEFLPVTPVNHLGNVGPTPGRAVLSRRFIGTTAFDLACRVWAGDFSYYNEIKRRNLDAVVQAYVTNISAPSRVSRDKELGLLQVERLLQTMERDGLQCAIRALVGTRDDNLSRSDALDYARRLNAVLLRYPKAVALVVGGLELTQGFEQDYMRDAGFHRELEACFDLRLPYAPGAGHGGEGVYAPCGSVGVHHEDRALWPDVTGQQMADAQRVSKRKIIGMEPRRIQAGGTGQATADLNFVRASLKAAEDHDLGGTVVHCAAGRGCLTADLDDVQIAALDLYAEKRKGTTPVPPPVGDPLLDADMRIDHIWYPIFVLRSAELRTAIAKEYTRLHGHAPAESDIQHNLWRACVERGRWVTMRRALAGVEG